MSLTDMSIFFPLTERKEFSRLFHIAKSQKSVVASQPSKLDSTFCEMPSATDMTNVHGRESSSFYFNFCVSSKLYIDFVSCHRCGLKPFLLY